MYINNKFELDTAENISPYLGNDYKEQYILELIKSFSNKIEFTKFNNQDELVDDASDILINQKVIGWFQGRMEFGPRALGNRSILADPRYKEMKDIINIKIKKEKTLDLSLLPFWLNKKHCGTTKIILLIIICLVLKKLEKIKLIFLEQ